MKKKQQNPDVCGICGLDPYCSVRIYHDRPFIDSNYYDLICFTCHSVPKKWEHDEKSDRFFCYINPSPFHLHTVQEMVADGWTKSEAEFAIKAVKKSIEKVVQIPNSTNGVHILQNLVFKESEIVGWPNGDLSLK